MYLPFSLVILSFPTTAFSALLIKVDLQISIFGEESLDIRPNQRLSVDGIVALARDYS